MTDHFKGDLIFYGCFLAGQILFILKRAASAVRSQSNPVSSRRQFLFRNWDVLSIRAVIELALFFYPWRHYSLAQLLSLVGIPDSFVPVFLVNAAESPFGAVALGYAADSILDALAMWGKLPAFVRNWIKENVPDAPEAPKP